jgi:preprotein translocase subunit SecE
MTFDNQSKEMHTAVLVLGIVSVISSILAAIFQGVYVHSVKTTLKLKKEKGNILEVGSSWTGPTGYALSIVTVVTMIFVVLYFEFDLIKRKPLDKVLI